MGCEAAQQPRVLWSALSLGQFPQLSPALCLAAAAASSWVARQLRAPPDVQWAFGGLFVVLALGLTVQSMPARSGAPPALGVSTNALDATLGTALPGQEHAPTREALRAWAAQWSAALADGSAYASAKTLLLADAGRRATDVLAALRGLTAPTRAPTAPRFPTAQTER